MELIGGVDIAMSTLTNAADEIDRLSRVEGIHPVDFFEKYFVSLIESERGGELYREFYRDFVRLVVTWDKAHLNARGQSLFSLYLLGTYCKIPLNLKNRIDNINPPGALKHSTPVQRALAPFYDAVNGVHLEIVDVLEGIHREILKCDKIPEEEKQLVSAQFQITQREALVLQNALERAINSATKILEELGEQALFTLTAFAAFNIVDEAEPELIMREILARDPPGALALLFDLLQGGVDLFFFTKNF